MKNFLFLFLSFTAPQIYFSLIIIILPGNKFKVVIPKEKKFKSADLSTTAKKKTHSVSIKTIKYKYIFN
jgi:hypothetical protein